jgi:hypothetical protein
MYIDNNTKIRLIYNTDGGVSVSPIGSSVFMGKGVIIEHFNTMKSVNTYIKEKGLILNDEITNNNND